MLRVGDFLTDQVVLGSAADSPPPLVSIILPTYRRRQLLERAMRSVLQQTCTDFELLVMDDGSTDGSSDLIESLRSGDPRIIHVRHERNCGLPAVRVNEGIELARGQYLAFQFDDDYWRPGALAALIGAAQQCHELSIIAGQASLSSTRGQWILPADKSDFVWLYSENRLANNSVLFPRELVDRFGLYDPHIGMRRLCDWDLWLRYMSRVPLVMVETVVSDINEGNPDAMGVTVPWDLALFRYLHDIPRDDLLRLDRWRDYEVDALSIGSVELSGEFRRRLYEEQIVPYYFKFRHFFPKIEGFPVSLVSRQQTVSYARSTYEPTQDIAFNPYDPITQRRGTYKGYYQKIEQLQPEWSGEAEAILLAKPVQQQAKIAIDYALAQHIPVGVYFDDDTLTFHEFGPQFADLAPGAPAYQNLTDMVRQADAVWVTTRFIAESVRPINPRLIVHNGCVPEEALPVDIQPRTPERPIKIGYVGSSYRLDEFRFLWEALVRLSRERRDQLQFEFWGLNIDSLTPLTSPVQQRPFRSSYAQYLSELRSANFDLLLTPLLDHPRPRLGKAPSKYYQTAVAGALGIFSDVPQYETLPAGLTCLKADNTVEAWYQVLCQAIDMPTRDFDRMRRRMLAHVRETYTASAQIHQHEAAWRATEFHSRSRTRRYADGRPRVVYFLHSAGFGGGELQLWRRLRLIRRYGIEPIVVLMEALRRSDAAEVVIQTLDREHIELEFAHFTCFTEPRSPAEFWSTVERDSVRDLLQRCQPALVHTVTFIPSVGQICTELNLPHVMSVYALEDGFAYPGGRLSFQHCNLVQSDSLRYAKEWGQLLGVPKFLAREVVPEEVFALGQQRHLENIDQPVATQPRQLRLVVAGTLQERKRQLETIEAVGRLSREGRSCLLDLYGYTHYFPRYVEQCHERVHAYGLDEHVRFLGFQADVLTILQSADVVLSLSTFESFPSAIKEAMSAGVLVVATPVGGVAELIIDGVTGILCADTSVDAITDGIRRALALTATDQRQIIEQARRVAHSEFHSHRAANDLLTMYNLALDRVDSRKQAALPAESEQPVRMTATAYGRLVPPAGPPQGYVRLVRGLTFPVVPKHANWMGLDVQVITQGRAAHGTVTLQVTSAAGQVVRRSAVDLAGVRDHDWVKLPFEPIANTADVAFQLGFSLSDAGPDTVVAFYETVPLESRAVRAARRLGLPLPGRALYCRMWYAGTEH